MLRQNKDDGDKATGVLQRKIDTPEQGCLHGAETWEPTTPFALPCKGQPLSLKYQPLSLFFADFLGKGRFGLDQEMSLLSHIKLSVEAKREGRTVLKKLRLAASCYWWGDPPFTLTVASN